MGQGAFVLANLTMAHKHGIIGVFSTVYHRAFGDKTREQSSSLILTNLGGKSDEKREKQKHEPSVAIDGGSLESGRGKQSVHDADLS